MVWRKEVVAPVFAKACHRNTTTTQHAFRQFFFWVNPSCPNAVRVPRERPNA